MKLTLELALAACEFFTASAVRFQLRSQQNALVVLLHSSTFHKLMPSSLQSGKSGFVYLHRLAPMPRTFGLFEQLDYLPLQFLT